MPESVPHRAHPRWRLALPVGLMLAIVLLGQRPVPAELTHQSDKLVHFAAYATVAGAWIYALAPSSLSITARGWWSFALASGWGLVDEFIQSFSPFRHASWGDVLADTAGAGACVLVVGLAGFAAPARGAR